MPRTKHRKPAVDRKEVILRVCVSAAERKAMEAAAARAGLALTSWLRMVGLHEAQAAVGKNRKS